MVANDLYSFYSIECYKPSIQRLIKIDQKKLNYDSLPERNFESFYHSTYKDSYGTISLSDKENKLYKDFLYFKKEQLYKFLYKKEIILNDDDTYMDYLTDFVKFDYFELFKLLIEKDYNLQKNINKNYIWLELDFKETYMDLKNDEIFKNKYIKYDNLLDLYTNTII